MEGGASDHREFKISGHTVLFPCKPYPSQFSMMDKIIKGIERHQNCLLESPTGSGKSLALLCSALAWQAAEKRKVDLANQIDGENGHPESCQCSCHKLKPETSHVSPPSATITTNTATLPSDAATSATSQSTHTTTIPSATATAATSSFSSAGSGITGMGSSTAATPGKKRKSLALDESGDGDDECCVIDDDSDEDFKPLKKFREPSKSNMTGKKKRLKVPIEYEDSPPSSPHPSTSTFPTVAAAKQTELSTPYKSTEKVSSETSNVKVTSPALDGASPCNLCTCETGDQKFTPKKIPKIYFGTRTHKQVAQIVRELRKTAYHDVPMTILGSREHTCIHPQVSNSSNKNEGCEQLLKDIGCRFKDRVMKFQSQAAIKTMGLDSAWDLEDLVHLLKKKKACPYFISRGIKDQSDLIICPYNYLVDPLIRDSMEINLKGQVVLLDEAHNIEDSVREAASHNISQENMQKALADMDGLMEKGIKVADISKLRQMCHKLDSFVDEKSMSLVPHDFEQSYKMWTGFEIIAVLNTMDLGPRYCETLQAAVSSIKAAEQEERQQAPGQDVPSLSSSTWTLLEQVFLLLKYLYRDNMKHAEDYRMLVVKSVQYVAVKPSGAWLNSRRNYGRKTPVETLSLNFWCMNPAVGFADFEQCRSVILTSGTLSPMDSFQSELAQPFPILLEANHVVKDSQVWVGAVGQGPDGSSLHAVYRNMETFTFQDALGQLILGVCQKVPKGVLCFLPSYKALEKLTNRWKATGLWSRLENRKHVMCEPRGSDKMDFELIIRNYYATIHSTEDSDEEDSERDGALFFAVCRGKVSEGLDFADNFARAVITVGIPYPNFKDLQVDLKKKYNDKYHSSRGLLSGSLWYEIQAFRALNQALGRCIRHRNDWGALIIVDERFVKNTRKYSNGLSKWVRQKLQVHSTCSAMLHSLSQFTQHRLQEQIKEDSLESSQLPATPMSSASHVTPAPHSPSPATLLPSPNILHPSPSTLPPSPSTLPTDSRTPLHDVSNMKSSGPLHSSPVPVPRSDNSLSMSGVSSKDVQIVGSGSDHPVLKQVLSAEKSTIQRSTTSIFVPLPTADTSNTSVKMPDCNADVIVIGASQNGVIDSEPFPKTCNDDSVSNLSARGNLQHVRGKVLQIPTVISTGANIAGGVMNKVNAHQLPSMSLQTMAASTTTARNVHMLATNQAEMTTKPTVLAQVIRTPIRVIRPGKNVPSTGWPVRNLGMIQTKLHPVSGPVHTLPAPAQAGQVQTNSSSAQMEPGTSSSAQLDARSSMNARPPLMDVRGSVRIICASNTRLSHSAGQTANGPRLPPPMVSLLHPSGVQTTVSSVLKQTAPALKQATPVDQNTAPVLKQDTQTDMTGDKMMFIPASNSIKPAMLLLPTPFPASTSLSPPPFTLLRLPLPYATATGCSTVKVPTGIQCVLMAPTLEQTWPLVQSLCRTPSGALVSSSVQSSVSAPQSTRAQSSTRVLQPLVQSSLSLPQSADQSATTGTRVLQSLAQYSVSVSQSTVVQSSVRVPQSVVQSSISLPQFQSSNCMPQPVSIISGTKDAVLASVACATSSDRVSTSTTANGAVARSAASAATIDLVSTTTGANSALEGSEAGTTTHLVSTGVNNSQVSDYTASPSLFGDSEPPETASVDTKKTLVSSVVDSASDVIVIDSSPVDSTSFPLKTECGGVIENNHTHNLLNFPYGDFGSVRPRNSTTITSKVSSEQQENSQSPSVNKIASTSGNTQTVSAQNRQICLVPSFFKKDNNPDYGDITQVCQMLMSSVRNTDCPQQKSRNEVPVSRKKPLFRKTLSKNSVSKEYDTTMHVQEESCDEKLESEISNVENGTSIVSEGMSVFENRTMVNRENTSNIENNKSVVKVENECNLENVSIVAEEEDARKIESHALDTRRKETNNKTNNEGNTSFVNEEDTNSLQNISTRTREEDVSTIASSTSVETEIDMNAIASSTSVGEVEGRVARRVRAAKRRSLSLGGGSRKKRSSDGVDNTNQVVTSSIKCAACDYLLLEDIKDSDYEHRENMPTCLKGMIPTGRPAVLYFRGTIVTERLQLTPSPDHNSRRKEGRDGVEANVELIHCTGCRQRPVNSDPVLLGAKVTLTDTTTSVSTGQMWLFTHKVTVTPNT